MKNMVKINSVDTEKEWNTVVDKAIRLKPQFIQIKKWNLMLIDFKTMDELLKAYKFTANKFIEEDNSVSLSLNEIDIVENAETEETAKLKLAESILIYANDYYKEFKFWNSSANRKEHLAYIFKALIINDINKIADIIII